MAAPSVVKDAASVTDGTVVIRTGSELTLDNGAAVDVNVMNAGDGVIRSQGPTPNRLEGTITNPGDILIEEGSTLIVNADSTYTNSGTLSLESQTAGGSTLALEGDVRFTGGGEFKLMNSTANIITAASTGGGGNAVDARLINVDQRISGAGQIGFNGLAITNQAMIDANLSEVLIIDPKDGADGLVNTGTLQASDGATLRIQNGTVVNTGGTIQALDGSTVELAGLLSISGGELAGEGTIQVTTASNVTLDGIGLINSGTLQVANGGITTLVGDITNAGTIELNSTGSSTQLRIDGPVTLDGGGMVTLSNFVQNAITSTDPGSSLVNEDNTIAGVGTISGIGLTNRSEITANQTNSLTINTTASGVINEGSLTADGSTLVLRLGEFSNDGGTIEAINGGTVVLKDAASITGGIVTINSGAQLELDNNVAVRGALENLGGGVIRSVAGINNRLGDAVANQSGAEIIIDSGTTVVLEEGVAFNNAGTIKLEANGGSATLAIDGAVDLNGGGEIMLSDASGNNIRASAGAVDAHLTSDQTIRGAGVIGLGLRLTNQGLIDANASELLIVDSALGNDGVTNTGVLQASGGSTLRLRNGDFNNAGGTIRALGGSVELTNVTVAGGELTTAGGVIRATGATTLDGVGIVNSGNFGIADNVTLTVLGSIENSGDIAFGANGSTIRLGADTTLTGGGTVSLSDAVANRINTFGAQNRLTNEDNIVSGAGRLQFIGLTNRGTIRANANNALTIEPSAIGVVNESTMEAVDGATLRLLNGDFDNTGGTIHAGGGSRVEIKNAEIVGGTLSSNGDGVLEVVHINNSRMANLMVAGNLDVIGIANLRLLDTQTPFGTSNTIVNNGLIRLDNQGLGSVTDLDIAGDNDLATEDVRLLGNGVVRLTSLQTRIEGFANPNTSLINGVDHTIAGQGLVGVNDLVIINRGTIDASGDDEVLRVNPSASAPMVNETTGVLRGMGEAGLELTSGEFDNQGTVEALNGSNVTYTTTAMIANNSGGTLTGGVWRSAAEGDGARLTLNGGAVSSNAADITLSGVGSVLEVRDPANTVTTTQLEASLIENLVSGALRILDQRDYEAVDTFTNTGNGVNGGTLELGGGTFSAASFANQAGAQIIGFGTIDAPILNSGTVLASGGTLNAPQGIDGQSGTIQIDPSATLVIGADSDADFLVQTVPPQTACSSRATLPSAWTIRTQTLVSAIPSTHAPT